MQYFSNFSMSVEDTSLTQLDTHSREWITHDIVVDGTPYDVKNARRSFSSRESYSEHCIPKFKETDRNKSEVAITGVLSDYLTIDQVRLGETGTSTILGNVTRTKISNLAHWFTNRFSGILELPELSGLTFLPGWIFEYPDAHQPRRREAKQKALVILREAYDANRTKNVPKWIAAFEDDNKLLTPIIRTTSDRLIWEHLREVDNQIGIARQTLFLAILGSTLDQATHSDSAYNPHDWCQWIYADPRIDPFALYRPVGLIDSQQYILNLITVFEKIWHRSRELLSRFHRFKLTHPAILKGQRDSGAWYTIIAYCGGWVFSQVKAKCRKTPIYMGESDWCPKCHHLICITCGYCSKDCSQSATRNTNGTNLN